MRIKELMTEKVLTIGPEAPIRDVARILVDNGISGLPVCDIEGSVLGVISEGDILYKEFDPREGRKGGPLGWIADGIPDRAANAKTEALTAGTAMSSPPITIAPWESATEAARIMCDRHVNRLPVVKDGRLVGIVTRADLVRAFTRTDAEIEHELTQDVLALTMWIDPGTIEVAVQDGRVALSGRLHTRSDVELLGRLVARVPGVVAVESSVEWVVDDTTRKGQRALEHPAR
ncbi:MAG: CBS domain-containing protein [Gaiellaceae bacterium]